MAGAQLGPRHFAFTILVRVPNDLPLKPMSRIRWVASLLIAFHVVALTSATIPDPEEFQVFRGQPHTSDRVAQVMRPIADQAIVTVFWLYQRLIGVVRPLRVVTRPYLTSGVGVQNWRMFSNPYTTDQYVRLDYYVSTDGSSSSSSQRLFREVVLPPDREEEIRILHTFQSKSILAQLEKYKVFMYKSARLKSADPAAESRRLFSPITKFYRRRLAAQLAMGERVVRTEMWFGAATIPPRGEELPDDVEAHRLSLLEPYRSGPTVVPVVSRTLARPRLSTEGGGDIVWTLLFIDEP